MTDDGRRAFVDGVLGLPVLEADPVHAHMALPLGTTGSLSPTFVPARPVCLAVKLPSAFTLFVRFPSALREPLGASVTL